MKGLSKGRYDETFAGEDGEMMALIFWNSQGVINIDYLEQCRTINGAYYAGKLRPL